LTDIFLVLLIIFMVTSTALVRQGMPVHLPKARAEAAAVGSTTVTITADRHITVNGERVATEELQTALQRALRTAADRRVILRGDRQVVLDSIVRIMTAAKAAGAEKISIATQPGGKEDRK